MGSMGWESLEELQEADQNQKIINQCGNRIDRDTYETEKWGRKHTKFFL